MPPQRARRRNSTRVASQYRAFDSRLAQIRSFDLRLVRVRAHVGVDATARLANAAVALGSDAVAPPRRRNAGAWRAPARGGGGRARGTYVAAPMWGQPKHEPCAGWARA